MRIKWIGMSPKKVKVYWWRRYFTFVRGGKYTPNGEWCALYLGPLYFMWKPLFVKHKSTK